MTIPDIIIPFRFDAGKAATVLANLAAAAKKKRQNTIDGTMQESTGVRNVSGSVLSPVPALGAISAVGDVFSAVRDGSKECADFVGKISKDFIELKGATQHVTAPTGNQHNFHFAGDKTRLDDLASASTRDRTNLQEQFVPSAFAHLEGVQKRPNAQQAEDYQQKVAGFAEVTGINSRDAAQLGGCLPHFSEGEQALSELFDPSDMVFKTIKPAPTPATQPNPQIIRSLSQGVSPEEATQPFALMHAVRLGEEVTGVFNSSKALANAELRGNGAGFGPEKAVTPLQETGATALKLGPKESAGEDVALILSELAPGIRERHRILDLLNYSLDDDGFERLAGGASQMPVNSMGEATKAHGTSASDKQIRINAEDVLETADARSTSTAITAMRHEARIALSKEQGAEQFKAKGFGRSFGNITGYSVEEQLANERPFENALDRSGSNRLGDSRKVEALDGVSLTHPGIATHSVQESLRRLVEFEEEKARARRSPAISAPPPKALCGARMAPP